MTGESRPVDKQPGEEVIGGTVNGSGSLRMRVAQAGDQTVLAGIMRLVQEAQTSKTRAQALADRAAYWLTLIAIGVARIMLLSRATYRMMVQNLAWAVGYNVIALPLAAVGIVMPAWVGGVLMSASTIIVAVNAQTLRGLRL